MEIISHCTKLSFKVVVIVLQGLLGVTKTNAARCHVSFIIMIIIYYNK